MDPITQGLLGAAVTQSFFTKKLGKKALPIGIVGGMLADLDVIFSLFSSDPLFALTSHRHFTHSLFFIPLGGLLCFFIFLLFPKFRKENILSLYLASMCAYATHAPLDVLTSYGTLFLWPLNNTRYSLDIISIIDPIYTGLLLVGVLGATFLKNQKPAWIGLFLSFLYLTFGFIQHDRALMIQKKLSSARGHTQVKERAIPTLGNLLLWRSVYVNQLNWGYDIYVDSLRIPLTDDPTSLPGSSLSKFSLEDIPKNIPEEQQKALQTVIWFSDDFLGVENIETMDQTRFIDTRYSALPWSLEPLWYLKLTPNWSTSSYSPAYEWIHTPFEWEKLSEFKKELFLE